MAQDLPRSQQTGRVFDDAWDNFLPYLQRINHAKICDIPLPTEYGLGPRVTALTEYQACLVDNSTSRPVTSAKGAAGGGGRVGIDYFITEKTPEHFAQDAARQAIIQLDAREAPAGEMEVVLGPGWPGIPETL